MKFFFSLLLILGSFWVNGQSISVINDSIHSDVLNESRNFKIILPNTYNNYKKIRYPVVYILDGDFLLQSTSGIIEYMSKTGQIPEMIQVYISNTDRTRDFTPSRTTINYEGESDVSLENSGGGDNFLKFLNEELLQYIHSKYRTNAYELLIGRSFAGLIGGYNYLRDDYKIDGYLLIDPSFWWDNQKVVSMGDSTDVSLLEKKKLYMSVSDNFKFSNYIELMRKSQENFHSKLSEKVKDSSRLKLQYFEDNTHGTVTIPSLYSGLAFIFKDFFLEGMKYRTADEILNHFSAFSEENKAEFTPLEPMIQWLATIQNEKDPKEALKLFEFNAKNYPKSADAQLNAARQYEVLEMQNQALEKYKAVLMVDSKNEEAKQRIEILKKD